MEDILNTKRLLLTEIESLLEEKNNPRNTIRQVMDILQKQANNVQAQLSAQMINERRMKLLLAEHRNEQKKYERYWQIATEAADKTKMEQMMDQKNKAAIKEQKVQEDYQIFLIQYEPLMEWNKQLLVFIEQLQQQLDRMQLQLIDVTVLEHGLTVTEGLDILNEWKLEVQEAEDRWLAERELRN